MKKLIAGAVTVAVLTSLFITSEPTHGQQGAEGSPSSVHKIGLIDMAEVFKEYDKFKALRESLQAEIERSEAQAKAMLEEMQRLNEQAKSGDFDQNSPQFKQIEQQLIEKESQLKSFRNSQQREFLKKESEIYKQVYLETQDTVKLYADQFDYTLVMRFNRSSVAKADNPQEVIQSMNRQVVFHRDGDDITEPVLRYLNSQYAKQTAAAPTR